MHGRGEAYRMGGDEFCVLAEGVTAMDELSRYSAKALATSGDGFSITAAHGAVSLPAEAKEPTAALALADGRMYGNKHSGRQPASRQSADVLTAVLEERAPNLAHHVRAVRDLACATAEALGMSGAELSALRHGAALHDIGKMAIPDSILSKPGPLSDDEWVLIQQHSVIGERILTAAPALEQSATLVRAHHERVDGGGYPDGLTGADIPLGARIIFVSDSFDAMTSERPYGPTLSSAEALAELRRCAGTQFDAEVVTAFEQVVKAAETPGPAPRPSVEIA
jgi:putative nucleotidyltransferase with HDIG domain